MALCSKRGISRKVDLALAKGLMSYQLVGGVMAYQGNDGYRD